MFFEHLTRFVKEDSRLLAGGTTTGDLCSLCAQEDFTLGEHHADETGKCRDTRRCPEERAPSCSGLRHESEVDDGGKEVADGITLLEDAGRETTDFNREVLKRGRGCEAPDTAHGDTKERPDGEELAEGHNESRAEFEDGDEKEVCDERPFATETVRDDAEDDLKGING